MKTLVFLSLFLNTFFCFADESVMESIYRGTYEAFTGKNCNSTVASTANKSLPCVAGRPTENNKADLQSFSENQFFNRLASFEKKRLQCGQQYWNSISSPNNNSKMIETMTEILPQLNSLKSKINQLKTQNAALWGQMPHTTNPRELEVLPRYVAQKKEYDDRAQQIIELNQLYEASMSQIPHSDIPEVRDFIEDHAGPRFLSKDIKKIETSELSHLIKKVTEGFQKNVSSLNEEVQDGRLSDSNREKLATDPYLIGQLLKESPNLSGPISKYQCLANNRKSGRVAVQTTANVVVTAATLVIPVASIGLARVGQMAFIARNARLAANLSSVSRGLGTAAMVLGSVNAVETLANTCLKEDSATVLGSCEQTPQTILAQKEISKCIFELTMQAASGGAGFVAKRMADRTSSLAKFVDEMKLSRRAQNLPLAGSLTDAERIAASEMILGGKAFTDAQRKALIEAHKVGPGFGLFSDADIALKRQLLKEGGFSNLETETLLWKGMAGKSPSASQLDALMKLDPSGTKSRLLADLASNDPKSDPAKVVGLYKEAAGKFEAEVKALKRSPNQNELYDIEYTASRWGSTTQNPEEIARAKALVGSSFDQRMRQEIAMYKGKNRDGSRINEAEYMSQVLSRIKSDPGVGANAEATRFQVDAAIKYLNQKYNWNIR